jgi:hypothetical protein
MSWKLLNFLG